MTMELWLFVAIQTGITAFFFCVTLRRERYERKRAQADNRYLETLVAQRDRDLKDMEDEVKRLRRRIPKES